MNHPAAFTRFGRVLFLACALAGSPALALQPDEEVPYVATPQQNVERMLEMAKPGPGDYLIDLGSGDGRFVITAAQRYGTRALGVEIDGILLKESRARAQAAGVDGLVEFRDQDLFETDLSRATVVTMYLLESVNLKLRPRLLAQLKPGARVVSHHYSMGAWKPDAEKRESPQLYPVFLWIVPADVAGVWETVVPLDRNRDRAYRLNIAQSFQEISGYARSDELKLILNEPRLTGERIELKVTDELDHGRVTWHARGRVVGDTIEGTVRITGFNALQLPLPELEFPWRAKRVQRAATAD
ncbi:MAG TPA: class I SAM-dependent methyltransferase [Pelomicrobium sp.]|nr:class I SAM-dependent methyltransferase [Pelomicrobium sp.]